MREIKFRAWDGKQMHYNIPIASVSVGIFLEFRGCAFNLMQFTGLLDKNGKEIYEGDVMRLQTIEGSPFPIDCVEVHWSDKEQGWLPKVDKDSTSWEIIGNIYENPELLK